MPSTPSPALLTSLRTRMAVQPAASAIMPFGDPRVAAHLPGGGLPLGHLHEIGAGGPDAETGALPSAFAVSLLAGLPDKERAIVWIAAVCDLYPPGLPAYGLDPARLLLVQAAGDTETLKAMETALREGGIAAVVGEVGRLDRLAARRLQLACGRHGATAFVVRHWPYGAKHSPKPEGNAAATRWRLRPEPSQAKPLTHPPQPGPPRWRVELLHTRGGRPGAWIMEKPEADNAATTHPLRVVAALADHPAAPPLAGVRAR